MTALDWLVRLHDAKEHPFERLGLVGLAILCLPQTERSGEVRHIGIVYRATHSGANMIHLLHVPEHLRSVRGQLRSDYGWLELALPRARARLVVAQCVRIMERYEHHGLPYGLRYACGKFSLNGIYKPNGDIGLTCATFALAVFSSVGLDLVRCEEWPIRSDDQASREQFIMYMHGRGLKDHANALARETEMKAPRFRPEEVAAAGTVDANALPLGFHDAASRGAAIVTELFRRTISGR